MKSILKTPQAFFIILAIMILIVGFLKRGTNLDLNYLLAFLLVDVWSVALVSALFFLLISVNYASLSLIGKKPKKALTIIHILLQIISLIPLLYYMIHATAEAQPEKVQMINIILILSFLIFFISVIVHLINFFYSLIRQNNS